MRKLLNNWILIFVSLLFFIPITFFSAYSEQCSDDKLCFKEGDYFVTESNMYGEEPSIRVIYKYFGLGDNDRIIIIKDITSLDPGMKSGETLPNGTIQWSNQSQDEIEIPRKYPYNNGYGQWIMFLPHMTIENLQKLFKNDKITE